MSTGVTLPVRLFDGRSVAEYPATLEVGEAAVRMAGDGWAAEFPRDEVRVSPAIGSAPRFIELPNGVEALCADHPALDGLPAVSRTERPVAWLERRVWVAVVAVVTTVAGVTGFYFFGLPRLADVIARRVSRESERALGKRTLALFEERFSRPTDLDAETRDELRSGFETLAAEVPPQDRPTLLFRRMTGVGPNAFALPGGTIVITDEMVEKCTMDESLAILAHELGHVRHRHALRHLAQELGVTALGAAVTSDASSTSLSMTTVPLLLARAKYSRNFEEEADRTGFELLRRAGYSPALFASCLERISKDVEGDADGYLSTHPPSAERIARAREAARGFVPKHAVKPP